MTTENKFLAPESRSLHPYGTLVRGADPGEEEDPDSELTEAWILEVAVLEHNTLGHRTRGSVFLAHFAIGLIGSARSGKSMGNANINIGGHHVTRRHT